MTDLPASSRRLCGHPHPDQPRTKAWCELLPDHAEEQHRSGYWSWFTQGIPWPTEPTPPALPPSLRSVEDVRQVCEAARLWTMGLLWEDNSVSVVADVSYEPPAYELSLASVRVARTDGVDLAVLYLGAPTSLLLAAIRSAREETP